MPENSQDDERRARTARLHLRLSEAELSAVKAKAGAAGMPASEFVRSHLNRVNIRSLDAERERLRLLRSIGVNLNQLARWANTHKARIEAVEVVAHLADVERTVRAFAAELFGEE